MSLSGSSKICLQTLKYNYFGTFSKIDLEFLNCKNTLHNLNKYFDILNIGQSLQKNNSEVIHKLGKDHCILYI
jgi:hypothetical protein